MFVACVRRCQWFPLSGADRRRPRTVQEHHKAHENTETPGRTQPNLLNRIFQVVMGLGLTAKMNATGTPRCFVMTKKCNLCCLKLKLTDLSCPHVT